MISKQDYYLAAFIGFFVGIFAIPTLVNIGFRERIVLILLPLVLPSLWAFGLLIGKLLSKWVPVMAQFSKFAAVGFLNTAIDFGILNLLSMATGITAGFIIGGVNIPGFAVALVNTYFWNKLWVFQNKNSGNILEDLPKFLVVTILGLFLNSSIVVLLTTYVDSPFLLNQTTWLNLAKVAATLVSILWNFMGYKFIVFRSTA